jgi:hypothetical protein
VATGGVPGGLDRLGVGVVAQAVERERAGQRRDAAAPMEGAPVERGGGSGSHGGAEEFGAADAARLPGALIVVEEQVEERGHRVRHDRERGFHLRVRGPPGELADVQRRAGRRGRGCVAARLRLRHLVPRRRGGRRPRRMVLRGGWFWPGPRLV